MYLSSIFKVKNIPYSCRRDNVLDQTKYNTVEYGFKSFKYQGTKLWNGLNTEFKSEVSLKDFKMLLSTWAGPTCQRSVCTLCNLKRM